MTLLVSYRSVDALHRSSEHVLCFSRMGSTLPRLQQLYQWDRLLIVRSTTVDVCLDLLTTPFFIDFSNISYQQVCLTTTVSLFVNCRFSIPYQTWTI
jgi:hypothetical protein